MEYFQKNYKKYIKYSSYIIIFLLIILILYKVSSYFYKEKVILILASDVFPNPDSIKPYLLDNVILITYDYYDVNSFSEIIKEVVITLDKEQINKVAHVGIMFHTKIKHTLSLFEQDKIRKVLNHYDLENNNDKIVYEKTKDFFDFLLFSKFLCDLTGASDLDLIACSIVNNSNSNILNLFSDNNFRINLTVSEIGGNTGKWYLEKGNVELIGLYFNKTIETSNIKLIA